MGSSHGAWFNLWNRNRYCPSNAQRTSRHRTSSWATLLQILYLPLRCGIQFNTTWSRARPNPLGYGLNEAMEISIHHIQLCYCARKVMEWPSKRALFWDYNNPNDMMHFYIVILYCKTHGPQIFVLQRHPNYMLTEALWLLPSQPPLLGPQFLLFLCTSVSNPY